ncbi:MAG: M48 family metallopeptidase [Gammaproteobacteria bacterium]|nr:M48 family metallopeptidase [Gammaproteobacteria bacterium]
MQYENPEIPEGINVTPEHHLKEFAVLVGGALALILAIVLLLGWLAESIAAHIPFSYEQEIAGDLGGDTPVDATQVAIERALQTLADGLVAHMQLPSEMRIHVHYVDDADTVNAFATLGGNVIVFRGLLEQMPSENALAMVMAHEITHVQHRDPIVSLGRGVVVGLALAAIAGVSGGDLTDSVFGSAGTLTALSFNRAQESAADASAVATLAAYYGHVNGAAAVFDLFARLEAEQPLQPPAFMASHPDSGDRSTSIAAQAHAHGWPLTGELTPVPEALRLQ